MASIDKTTDDDKLICWARGDSDTKVFTITDATTKLPLDISGNTYKLTVNDAKDPDPVGPPIVGTEQFTIIGVFVTDGTDGKVGFAPTTVNTDITPATYFYDIEETVTATSEVRTLIKAKCKILMDITK